MANSGQLPRPPAHGRYDLGNNEARRRKANMMKFGCVGVLAAIIIGLGIYGIILLLSFKNAQVPHFQVKAVEVAKFNVADVVMAKQKVLSTDLAFNLESDNKNPMVGVSLENMVMETSWNEVEAHLGEAHIENVALNSKGVSTLKVTTRGEVEISKKLVNKEDMKLDLVLSGDLKFVHGPFKTKTYPFMVSCNEIKGVSTNAACDSKLFSNGIGVALRYVKLGSETPPPSTRKVKAPAAAPQATPPQAATDKPATELPAEKQPPSSSSKEFVPQASTESAQGKEVVESPAVDKQQAVLPPTVAPQVPGGKPGATENATVSSLPKESLPPTPQDKALPESQGVRSLPKESLPPTPQDKALPEPQPKGSLPPTAQDKALPEPQAVPSNPKESLPPLPQEPRAKPMTVEPKLPPSPPKESFPPVKLDIQDKFVILSNGLLAVTIANPDGFITGINYNGIDNILDTVNPEDDRGYWDVVWAPPGTKGTKGNFQRIVAKEFRVIVDRPDQIELSFKLPYNPSTDAKKAAPMEIDQRYVMMQGVSGIYAYGIFERAGWDQFGMPNARLAFKLQRQMFKYLVVADNRQREMPVPEDRMKPRGQELEYPEAVLLVDPIDPKLKGEVDDKYQYSKESQDIRVHGWICKDPPSGFWQITPSFEFRSGGPNKQFLTSHVGPSTLAMFVSAHYSGEELIPKFQQGEPWNHIYGPIFMYMNNQTKGPDFKLLWEDAKQRMLAEVQKWPYSFPASEDFPKANERVNVTGRFFVHDKYVTNSKVPAKNAFIGLGPVGEAGSWQRDCKTYQFWTRTDEEGFFTINYVRVGTYDVHGFVDGYIGDFKHKTPVSISVGRNVDLDELVFEPLRDGPTLWEIGIPDRTAKEFYVPDPNPKYVNKLYVNHPDKFRQYGLWERYGELYPKNDLVYDVHTSDYKKDWFYAQVTRQIGARYNGTTWQVKFQLDDVAPNGIYKLRLALASATNSDLEVRFNQPKPSPAIFTSGRIGNDNSIARHGIHGLYWLFNIDVKGSTLVKGTNTMFLTQTKGVSPFQGLMYDYIRLEGPARSPK